MSNAHVFIILFYLLLFLFQLFFLMIAVHYCLYYFHTFFLHLAIYTFLHFFQNFVFYYLTLILYKLHLTIMKKT